MTLLEYYFNDLKPYQDPEGFYHAGYPEKKEPGQNSARTYCEVMLGAIINYGYGFYLSEMGLRSPIYKLVSHGKLVRHPDKANDQNSVDEYLAFALLCKETKTTSAALSVYLYAKKHFWVVDNDGKPSVQDWLFRFRPLGACYRIATGWYGNIFTRFFTAPWDRFILCMAILFSKRDQDGYVLTWMLIRLAKQYWACRLVTQYWKKHFKRKYPYGVGQVLEDYYGKSTPWTQALCFIYD